MAPVSKPDDTEAAPEEQAEAAAAWPDTWPVQQEDPTEAGCEEACLAPGAALQACSGSDIYLARNATTLSKKNTKYLAILPGVWSFRKNKDSTSTSATTTNDASFTFASSSQPEEDESGTAAPPMSMTQETQDTAVTAATPGSTSNAQKSTTTTDPIIVARLENADSAAPTLTIPLETTTAGSTAGSTSVVKLTGQRIQTTTKFVLLTVQPKKGRVVCKSIFSSCLVFGQPTLHGASASAAVNEQDSDSDLEMNNIVNDNSEHDNEHDNTALDHYGGSCRATDGSLYGKPTDKTVVAKSTDSKLAVHNDNASDACDDNNSSDDNSGPDNPVELQEDSSSAADDDEFKIKIDKKLVTRKTPSRRLSKKTIKYNEMDQGSDKDDEEEEEGEEKSDSDDDEESDYEQKGAKKNTRKAPPAATRRKRSPTVTQTQKDDEGSDHEDDEVVMVDEPTTKRSRRQSRQSKQKVDLGDQDDSDDKDVEPATKRSRRQSKQPKKKVVLSDRDESDDSSKAVEKPPVAKKRKSTARGKQTSKIVNLGEQDDSDASDEVVEKAPVAKKRKSTARAKRTTKKPEAQVTDLTADESQDSKPADPKASDEEDSYEQDNGAYRGELDDDSEEEVLGKESSIGLPGSQVSELSVVGGKDKEREENANGVDNDASPPAAVQDKEVPTKKAEPSAAHRKRGTPAPVAKAAPDVPKEASGPKLSASPAKSKTATPVKSEVVGSPPGSRAKRRRKVSPKKKTGNAMNLEDDDMAFLG